MIKFFKFIFILMVLSSFDQLHRELEQLKQQIETVQTQLHRLQLKEANA
jgi:prefoldin subunit 5